MTQTKFVFCNACGNQTRHTVEGAHKYVAPLLDTDGNEFGQVTCRSALLICQGCGNPTLETFTTSSEESFSDASPRYYPPRRKRPFPNWLFEILHHSDVDEAGNRYSSVRDPLREIYAALANQNYRLAAMGIRALIEYVIIDRVGDKGTFEKNLSAFYDGGYISAKQKKIVEVSLDVGSAAIHRNHLPSEEDVNFGLSVAETLLQMVYIQEPQSEVVGKRVPKRDKARRTRKKATPKSEKD